MLMASAAALAAFAVTGAAPAKPVKVEVGSNYYEPAKVTIPKNGKVRWVWAGGFQRHDVKVKSGPAKFASPSQGSGTYERKLTKPGTYRLFCTQHEMTMTVTVRKARKR